MKKGFTLIEILVFTSIVSIFFVVAIAVATSTLRAMKYNENKIRATRYAEELEDWLRGEKEADWNSFQAHVAVGLGSQDYCFNDTTLTSGTWPPPGGGCWSNYFGLSGIFNRTVHLSNISSDQTSADITVQWYEKEFVTQTVQINTVFSRF